MKLQASEINYRSLLNNTFDGFCYCQMIFDEEKNPVDFLYLEVNDNFEELTGLAEVVGKKVTEVIKGIKKTNPELFEIYGRVALTGKPERFEVYLKPLARWFLISVYSSTTEYFTAVFQNITERKQTEKKLEDAKIAAHNVFVDLNAEKNKLDEAKAKEEAILASIADGVIAVDKDAKIMLMNGTAETMLGYSSNESIGKQWFEVLQRQDEKGNSLRPEEGAISAALTTKTTTKALGSFYYLRKDGSRFPVSRTVSPIVLKENVIGAINIFRDITHEKEIDRVKNEFVSLASHQLRTPLTGIAWTIELFMKKETLTPKGKEYLNDILFSVNRSSALVKLLLNTSRIENGSVGVHPESLELIDFIKQNLSEYQPLCDKKKLSLVFRQHPKALTVITDINLFGYIFQNIVTNAIDYTNSSGTVEIVLEKKEDSLLLEIRDTGVGIPKSEQGRIFGKFVRATNAVIAKPDGTGLGLYIAFNGAKLLGGEIWFQSPTISEKELAKKPEERGSTFFVKLPLISQSQVGEKELI